MNFKNDYYYSNEAEQYTFYRIPKALFIEEHFKKLSSDAKILYGLMLDRMGLSIKNNWCDEQNKVYIYFTLENTQEYMNCGHTKAIKIVAELDKIGLIERMKQGQGKPTKIYVKKFITHNNNSDTKLSTSYPQEHQDIQKEEVQTSTNDTSRVLKIGSPNFSKADTNNNDYNNNKFNNNYFNNTDFNKNKFNNTDFNNSKSKSVSCLYKNNEINNIDIDNNIDTEICPNNSNISTDEKQKGLDKQTQNKEQIPTAMDTTISGFSHNRCSEHSIIPTNKKCKELEEYIKEQINYDTFIHMDIVEKDEVDAIVLIILDVLMCNQATVRIGGQDKPYSIVESVFKKIDYCCIIYAINKFKEQKHEIIHKKAYLLTCLYNAQMEGVYNGINCLNTMGVS